MGVADSKVLAEAVLMACRHAESEGKPMLNDKLLWSNQDTIEALKKLYEYIPKNIRRNSGQTAIKKAINRSKTGLNIHPVIQGLQKKSVVLFPAVSSNNVVPSTPSSPLNNILVIYYSQVLSCQERQTVDTIRLRVLYVALYRVKQELQPEHKYDYYISNYIAQAVLKAGCVDHQPDVINANVRLWINYGERYHLIANDLGGLGALYLLPDIGGQSLWAKELPKSATNQKRISLIQNLKNHGLCEEARRRNLHVLAEEETSLTSPKIPNHHNLGNLS
ncbi:hypothetical protein BJY01DRAFT_262477 [Aspergillus pseudoustus]|uniref:Uncharacterized protein n=1 Tax=Aspergillus pseudoustus TaxID=1810923 RepID=A0ABR4IE34_9EURO